MATKPRKGAAVAPKTAPAVTTTVQVNEKIAKAIETVKAYYPHVKIVYVNSDGHFHFHSRPGFSAINLDESEIAVTEENTESGQGEETAPIIPPQDNLEF